MSSDPISLAPVAVLDRPTIADSVPSPVPPAVAAPLPISARRRFFRMAASLPLAITLLSLFTLCLALATFIESAYGSRIARELVYRTWWFALLLGLLAVNVLCAALKKYPWKRHQTGFLITHAGLLVLVLGGLLSALGGTEGQMTLIDSENRDIQQRFHIANKADTIQLADEHRLEVFRVPAEPKPDDPAFTAIAKVIDGGVEPGGELTAALKDHFWSIDLAPGSLGWYDDEHYHAGLPAALRFLQVLADPFPSFARDLDGTTSVAIHNFYPHTELWPFSKAGADEPSCAALRLRLTTPMTRMMEHWVSSVPAFERDPLPLALDLMTLPEPALLSEFNEPPAPAALGKLGQLVLIVGRQKTRCRVDLDALATGTPFNLPGTDLAFTLLKTGPLMDLLGHEGAKAPAKAPMYPAVQFELSSGGRKGTYVACARLPNLPAFQKGDNAFPVAVWYHHPDFRAGDASKMGALQFLQTPDEKVYYRVYGKDGLRQTGREVDVSDNSAPVSLPWQAMTMQFQVTAYLPHAAKRSSVVPKRQRPGAENVEGLTAGLRCTLTADGQSEEFWVRLSRQATRVRIGKALYLVRYRSATKEADFALTLKHAYQTTDPGTNRPASYQSDVLVGDKKSTDAPHEYSIYMNHPLSFGPYKVYQSQYQPLTDPQSLQMLLDDNGRLVSMSGLSVAHDPGLWCKYLGSSLLVLGIATMFYMRAYFFKVRPVVV